MHVFRDGMRLGVIPEVMESKKLTHGQDVSNEQWREILKASIAHCKIMKAKKREHLTVVK